MRKFTFLFSLFAAVLISGCGSQTEAPKANSNAVPPPATATASPVVMPSANVNAVSNKGKTENADLKRKDDRDDVRENRPANRREREKNERDEDERKERDK